MVLLTELLFDEFVKTVHFCVVQLQIIHLL